MPNSKESDFPEWIEIFQTGVWTDKSGRTDVWTEADLDEIAKSYDPKKWKAPLVIGHPEDDSPAYGWVETIKREGSKLLVKPGELIEEFKDWVKRGLYRNISMALSPDMTLKHIGFLGGKAPAVKGLKPVEFFEKTATGWEFEMEIQRSAEKGSDFVLESDPFSAPMTITKKGGIKMTLDELWEKIEGIFKAKKEIADHPVFSEADVQAKVKEAEARAFAETEKLKKEKADAEAKLAAFAEKDKKDMAEQRKKEISAFCEAQVKEGKLTPALRKLIEPVMIFAAMHEGDIEFSEGQKKAPVEILKDFLKEIPKMVTFSEVAGGAGPGSVGSAAEKLSALTKQKMEAKKDLSYTMAFAEVQRENIELARELLAEIKQK